MDNLDKNSKQIKSCFNFTPNINYFKNCKFSYLIFLFLDNSFCLKKSINVSEDICSICLKAIQFASILDACSHIFCKACITKWEKISKICPLCRSPFSNIINYNNQASPINLSYKSQYNKRISLNNNKIRSHKLSDVVFCDICKNFGTAATVFTCQICKKYNVHFWCEETINFELGIYICPACNKLRINKLNEI